MDLIVRSPILKVAIIENITSHPIEIGRFITRENDIEILRERSEDGLSMKLIKNHNSNLFPIKILKSKEKFLVPLEVYFKYSDNAVYYLN